MTASKDPSAASIMHSTIDDLQATTVRAERAEDALRESQEALREFRDEVWGWMNQHVSMGLYEGADPGPCTIDAKLVLDRLDAALAESGEPASESEEPKGELREGPCRTCGQPRAIGRLDWPCQNEPGLSTETQEG